MRQTAVEIGDHIGQSLAGLAVSGAGIEAGTITVSVVTGLGDDFEGAGAKSSSVDESLEATAEVVAVASLTEADVDFDADDAPATSGS